MTELICPYCGIEIDEHEANTCFDDLIAEKVMGWHKGGNYDTEWRDENDEHVYDVNDDHGGVQGFYPSHYIYAAWEVVEKLNSQGYVVEIVHDCVAWSVVFMHINGNERVTTDWKASLPVQICRAAIKATIND